MRRQLLPALRVTACLTVLLGLLYPLGVWAVSQVLFRHQADGSLVRAGGRVVGSSLIGQRFADRDGNPLVQYFQPRPSAAGANGYDPTSSSASNLGPSSEKLLSPCLQQVNPDGTKACDPSTVPQRAIAYRLLNGLPTDAPVPVDAVTASGSGLDPDISVANALDQAPRVARARGLPLAGVRALVAAHVHDRDWGFLGEKAVRVLELNLALDGLNRSG